MKLALVLFLSAFLHLLAALWLVFYQAPAGQPPQAVTVIYRKPAPSAGGAKRGASAKSIPLSALIPKFQIRLRDANDTEAESTGAAGGLTMEQTQAISFLWRRIDRNIEDNPFLSEHNHTGKVVLRFDIDEFGQLVPGTLWASASDRVLKVIAARAVRQAFHDEGADIHAPGKRTRILARFSWTGYQACESLRGENGNELSFCHYAENKRKSFSAGERTVTWASAIYNHGPWAYEDIQKYNREERRRKSEFNPFKKYELDPDWNL